MDPMDNETYRSRLDEMDAAIQAADGSDPALRAIAIGLRLLAEPPAVEIVEGPEPASPAFTVIDNPDEFPEEDDVRPHSRACGWRHHEHGTACSPDCPTCGGR